MYNKKKVNSGQNERVFKQAAKEYIHFGPAVNARGFYLRGRRGFFVFLRLSQLASGKEAFAFSARTAKEGLCGKTYWRRRHCRKISGAIAGKVNQLISQYRHLIVGRMGIPHHGTDSGVIALIVEGSTDDVGAFTGRLGNLPGVIVKSALTAKKEAPVHD